MQLPGFFRARFSSAFGSVSSFGHGIGRDRAAVFAALLFSFGLHSAVAGAQGVTFAWAQKTLVQFNSEQLPFSALGLAVDGNGDVFIADAPGNYAVKEIMAVNGSIPINPVVNALISGGILPLGLAVDGKGNLYVADAELGVVEYLAVDGILPGTPTVRTVRPPGQNSIFDQGIGVDASGNLYYVGSDAVSVIEYLAVDGSVPENPTSVSIGSGLLNPQGVAVDKSGNIFVADTGHGLVKEFVAVDGTVPANPTIRALTRVENPIKVPRSLGVDSNGNVFVEGFKSTSLAQQILAVDGSVPDKPVTVGVGKGRLDYSRTLAMDPKGNVFTTIAGYDGIDLSSQVGGVAELQFGAVNFGSVDLCPAGKTGPPCSAVIPLTYTIAAGTTLGGVNILTSGAKNLDFKAEANDGSTTLCTAQTYGSATTCTVDVSFLPLASGTRNGTVEILDGTGSILATTNIYGSGLGAGTGGMPVAKVSKTALQFGTLAYGSSSKPQPLTITNTGSGTLYVTPTINGLSYKILTSTCGSGISAGNSCNLQVYFEPATVNHHDDTLTLQTNGSNTPTVALQGYATGVGPKIEGALHFGTIPSGTSKVLLLTLLNVGVEATAFFEVDVSGPSYTILTTADNTCTAGISAGQSCTIPIEFKPTKVGVHDDFAGIFLNVGPVHSFFVPMKGVAD